MKLARPDVFHPRIVLAGCPQLVEGDGDDAGLVKALRNRGLHARWLSWDDPQTLDADLVILRATWDYAERRDEFLAWASRVRNLLNAPAVVTWNSDKHYLRDLADAGVPTIPSYFFEPGDRCGCRRARSWSSPRSAPARSTPGGSSTRPPRAHMSRRCRPAGARLVQPYDARVEQGRPRWYSWAAGSRMPSPRVRCCRRRASRPLFTSPAPTSRSRWRRLIRTSRCGMSASPRSRPPLVIGIETSELLYARVDLIGDAEEPLLLEFEVVEPGLGWCQLDERTRELQQRAFAVEVESALERLGLGPLSHRRP